MINESLCLPFRIPDVYWGFAKIQGILKGSREGLILDFEVQESLLDLLKLDSKVTTIPIADIAELELKKGWFSRWIILRVNRLESLRQVPGSQGGELRLKIARKDTSKATEFVSSVQIALTTQDLKSMLKDME